MEKIPLYTPEVQKALQELDYIWASYFVPYGNNSDEYNEYMDIRNGVINGDIPPNDAGPRLMAIFESKNLR